MLMKIVAALAVIVIGFVAFVATRPSEYRVARTVTMAAPAPAAFAQVNDFHRWGAWNPWAKLDPTMKQAYEGAPAGPGAIYTWAGNKQVGEGRMIVHLFVDMDKMVGGNFERGLADMKSVVEAGGGAR